MKHIITSIVLALMAMMVFGQPGFATDAVKLRSAADSLTEVTNQGGGFWVEEESWVEYMDQQLHQQFFLQARDALKRGNSKEAAQQLNHGVLYMRLEAGRATPEAKPMLKQSETQLKQVVDELKKGTMPPSGMLDTTYARANLALALHHYLKAKDNWDDRAAGIVGHDLKAAVNELQFAYAWSGRPLDDKTKKAAYDIAVVGQKMIDSGDYTTADVDNTLTSIGQQIDAFSKSFK